MTWWNNSNHNKYIWSLSIIDSITNVPMLQESLNLCQLTKLHCDFYSGTEGVVNKPETKRLSIFFPFLSEIQFFHVFSPNTLRLPATTALNSLSYWYEQHDLIAFPIVNLNPLIRQHLINVDHCEQNCKIGISAHRVVLFARFTFALAKIIWQHLVNADISSVLHSVI